MATDAHWTAAIVHCGPARIVDLNTATRLHANGATLNVCVFPPGMGTDNEGHLRPISHRDQIDIGRTYDHDSPDRIDTLWRRAKAAAAGMNSDLQPMPSKAQLAAGFDLARLTSRPDFREWLRGTGWTNGDPIITATADEPVTGIIAGIYDDVPTPVLVAVQDGAEPFGYTFLRVEPVPCLLDAVSAPDGYDVSRRPQGRQTSGGGPVGGEGPETAQRTTETHPWVIATNTWTRLGDTNADIRHGEGHSLVIDWRTR